MKNNIGYRKALSRVSRMICVSESVRRLMIESRLLEPHRIVTIHNGIDLDRYRSNKPDDPEEMSNFRQRLGLPHQRGAPLIGVVGQLAAHKGQEDFIKAAAIVSKTVPSAGFVIIGRDHSKGEPYKTHLNHLISSLHLSDRLTLIGHIDQLPAVMAAFDILVLPSTVEAFGLVLVEAMASGTNVIATDIGGPNEVIRDQETGLLVSPNNPEQIASGVLRLLNEPLLKLRLADNALLDVAERFSAEKMITETEKVYQLALNDR